MHRDNKDKYIVNVSIDAPLEQWPRVKGEVCVEFFIGRIPPEALCGENLISTSRETPQRNLAAVRSVHPAFSHIHHPRGADAFLWRSYLPDWLISVVERSAALARGHGPDHREACLRNPPRDNRSGPRSLWYDTSPCPRVKCPRDVS
ncbi:unnamed protein product, partial [Iphiclides podalirius]